MSKENKNFIESLKLSAERTKAILSNKMNLAIFNIIMTAKLITFDAITDWSILETIELKPADLPIWDIFSNFRTTKNAINTMLAIAEGGKKLNAQTWKEQSRITPKREIEATTFKTFFDALSTEEKNTLRSQCVAWYNECRYTEIPNFFEMNLLNKGGKLQNGTYILYTQKPYSYYARIFQTNKDGWVSVVDEKGFFTLLAESSVEVIDAKVIPAEMRVAIDANFDQYTEAGEIARDKALDRWRKLAEKEAQAREKAELKAEAEEAKNLLFQNLQSLKLTSEAKIKDAIAKLNQAKLPKTQQAEIKNKIETARTALKAKKTAPKAEAPKATPEAGNKAKATPTKATATTRKRAEKPTA